MAATDDGVVYAGGTFSTVRPPDAPAGTSEQPAVNFAAFDAATGAPTGCKLSFTQSSGTATVRALALSPDGETLYAGGQFASVNGVGVSNIAAIDTASCTPRTNFKLAVSATVRALAVTEDTVYLGGDFNSVAGQTRNKFAAVTTAAALKPWKANTDEVGRAVQVTPDGSHVVIGGDFFTVNGTTSHALAVVNAATGALDKSYPGFIPNTSTVQDLTADATKFYTANEGTGGGVFDGRIAVDLTTFQQVWRDTCLGATQAILVHKGCSTAAVTHTTAPRWVSSPTSRASICWPSPWTTPSCCRGSRTPTTASGNRSAPGRWPRPTRAAATTSGWAASSPRSTAQRSRG